MKVGFVTPSELWTRREAWSELLSLLKQRSIEPIVILSQWSDFADELVLAGVMPVVFPIGDALCVAAEKTLVENYARFIRQLKIDAMVILGSHWSTSVKAATVAGVPAFIHASDDSGSVGACREVLVFAAASGNGLLLVDSPAAADLVHKRLTNLKPSVTVLARPGMEPDELEDLSHRWADILTAADINRLVQDRDNQPSLSLRNIVQNPEYDSSELHFCVRYARSYAAEPQFADEELSFLPITSIPAQVLLQPTAADLSSLRLMFFLSTRRKCLCLMNSAEVHLTMKTTLNRDFAIRRINIPLTSIVPGDWSEIYFGRLDISQGCGIILEFAVSGEVESGIDLRLAVKRSDNVTELPSLYA